MAVGDGIRRYLKRIERNVPRAMMAMADTLHEASHYYIPIDTQDMWDTSYTRKEGNGFDTVAVVAFTAPYAVYVHQGQYTVDGEEFAHGSAYNLKHADWIAAGLTHPRRPQEQKEFLLKPMRDKVVQSRMVERGTAELRKP